MPVSKLTRLVMTDPDPYVLMRKIRKALTPDLKYRRYQIGNKHPLYGYCYVASEALYHALGGKDSQWVPVCGKLDGDTHWWLRNRSTGELLDPTEEQLEFPAEVYATGVPKGFLTAAPSRRAKSLLEKIF